MALRCLFSMKHSIQKKINALLAISLIALSFMMIAFNLFITYRDTVRNSEIIMKETCSAQASALNHRLGLVEQSVKNLYAASEKFRPEYASLKDPEIAERYVCDFLDAAVTAAENTNGALAIYFRVNPDITHSGTTGFFYTKSTPTGKFHATENTDLYAYDVNDVEHVGWYYIPVWAGSPLWMEPYYNANIDVEMISYVIPIYEKNNLIGVLGMDVDFNTMVDLAEDIHIYDSCGAVLCSMNSTNIYYNRSSLLGKTIPGDIYPILQSSDASDKIFYHQFGGERYGLYYETLDNRMKLMLYAKQLEIFQEGITAAQISLVIFGLVFAGTLTVSLKMGKRIIKPISDITEASKQYAQGNWDVKLICCTQDELQLLTENISIMAEKTHAYIQYIQDMARTDGLTGIRNRTAYLMYVDKINQKYIPDNCPFAVIVFDVNNLKYVNDNLGHEKGDELLQAASQLICRKFSHSPVFRIGGDEFIAILDGEDYPNRDELIKEFQKYMDLAKNSPDPMEVCIACGMGVFQEDGAGFDALFDAADQRMYQNKVSLKSGSMPR